MAAKQIADRRPSARPISTVPIQRRAVRCKRRGGVPESDRPCEAVIAESCYLLRNLHGAPEAVLANVERGVFQVPFRLEGNAAEVRTLLRKYRKVPMDLADACLVRLAGLLRTGAILTLDGDFRIYRWNRNRRFEYLLDIE